MSDTLAAPSARFVRTFSASEGVPLADVLNKRVWVTGRVRDISPEQAWHDHITGRRALLGLGRGGRWNGSTEALSPAGGDRPYY